MEQTIEMYTVLEAVDRLRSVGVSIGQNTLRDGIGQGAFPFGIFIRQKHPVYKIFKRQRDEWIAERAARPKEAGQ
jgi:hypothetical protein